MIYRFAEFLFKIPGAFLAEVEKLTLKLKMDLPGPPVILKKKKKEEEPEHSYFLIPKLTAQS